MRESGSPVEIAVQAVVVGTGVMLAGTMPRNLVFLANLRFHPELPWAVPVVGIYLWLFWRYLGGSGPPASTADVRRESLRAAPLRGVVWRWALLAGGLAIAALVVALRLANRFVTLPAQQLPDLSHVPTVTILSLLLMGAPVAGAVEEAAFRGYMQGPIERACGIVPAVLVSGTMFAVAHLDFTPVLWPYYVAVAAIYGTVTWRTGSILPAIVLHTAGNVYSNLDLWVHGQTEWQAGSESAGAIWPWIVALVALIGATAWFGSGLARVTRARTQAAVEGRAT